MPSTANGTTCGSSVSGPKVHTIDCNGRTQRSEPGSREAAPQRMLFGQGKSRMMGGRTSATISGADRPGRSITATWKSPFFGSERTSASSMEERPAPRRKPCTALSGAPTRGPRRSSRVSGERDVRPRRSSTRRLGVQCAAAPS